MTTRTRAWAIAAAVTLAGCVERKEKITVEPDGTVTIAASFNADSEEELYDGDAVPTLAAGWFVEEWVELDDDDKPRVRLDAEAIFPPQIELPANYAVAGDARSGLYLQFPTTVIIEDRRDAAYYHFHRVYRGREWAAIEALRELLIDERTKHLKDKDPDELTVEDRKLLLRSYADFEAAKMLTFARGAFLEVTPEAPQDGWLAVEDDVNSLKGEIDYDRLARIAEIEDKDEREQEFADEARAWEERVAKRLRDALQRNCNYSGRQVNLFFYRYDDRRQAYAYTTDLGDDVFEITVELPGRIIGSNADTVSGRQAVWKFSGRRFRDRDVELMASSRLEYQE